jgi:predicted ATP-dependent endonuclease of OLD family
MMPLITRLMLQNFKKFPELDVSFCADRNVLIGDNESGKSTILLALDLVLSDSRHRVEALGVESSCHSQRSDASWKASAARICYPC